MAHDLLTLDQAIMGAAEAPPDRRIEFRDPIARFGKAGIGAVEPWLTDPEMFRFAVRVVVKAGELGASEDAKAALAGPLSSALASDMSAELAWGIRQLGGRLAPSKPRSKSVTASSPVDPSEQLVVGRVYRRRDLHHAGWGGNWQSGVSYPANGDHVLLFSDPTAAGQHGYRDGWMSDKSYAYFGAWSGTGDMVLAGVNNTILERSPNLLLLVRSGGGWRFEGYFSCDQYEYQRTERDGAEYVALVFHLERVR